MANINFSLSENPNHYVMIVGVLLFIMGLLWLSPIANEKSISNAVLFFSMSIFSIFMAFRNINKDYHLRRDLDNNIKRKELGFELKIPKGEKIKNAC